MIGLCAIVDPPRPECAQAIKEAHGAGVRVAMITGDHKDTALAIGATLVIVSAKHLNAVTSVELDAMDEGSGIEKRIRRNKHNLAKSV